MEEQTNFEEVIGGNIWQFEKEGDNIEGELKDKEIPGQYGNNFLIKCKSGEDFVIFGGAVLNTKMVGIEVGKTIRITYLGEVKGQSGRNYKDFKVEVSK